MLAHGFCDFTPANGGEQVVEAPIDFSYRARKARWVSGGWMDYSDPPPVPTITRRQVRLWLLRNGLKAKDVVAAINTIDDLDERERALIEWEDATVYHYDHPLFAQLAPKLRINPSQLPAEFRNAAQL